MTARQMRDAIEPGSTDYGDRQTLEAGLAEATQQSTPAPADLAAPAPAGGPGDPLSMLLEGGLGLDTDAPLTSGLSVGPGPGPALSGDPVAMSQAERLRMVATQAASPQLRAAARRLLKRLDSTGERL